MVTPLTPEDPARLGDFTLAGRLGEGGQGVVYLAHGPTGEAVAVKLLTHSDPETRARLARELDALESVASFCTARVLTASTEGQRPWVVSEFIDGPSVADRVRERGPLRGGDLERLVVGTATALAAIHAAGVVHRDFKPGNVLLGPDGPRVVDFGIARAEGASTMTSGLIGTPTYLAPEQIHGSPASAASDVFAWGATMVYAATGMTAFGAETVPAVLQRVLYTEPDLSALPPRLQGLIAACLTKDPAGRPTARDLMVELVNPNRPSGTGPQAAATQPPAWTGPVGPPQVTSPAGRGRSRGVLIGAVAVVVALVGAAAVGGVVLLNRATPGVTTSATPAAQDQTSKAATTPAEEPTTQETANTAAAKIPAAFAGTWKGDSDGKILDKEFKDHPVTIVLAAGKTSGTWESHDPQDPGEDKGCTKGRLEPVQVGESAITFNLKGLTGTCATYDMLEQSIVITLTKKGEGQVDYAMSLPMIGPSGTAVLTKSG